MRLQPSKLTTLRNLNTAGRGCSWLAYSSDRKKLEQEGLDRFQKLGAIALIRENVRPVLQFDVAMAGDFLSVEVEVRRPGSVGSEAEKGARAGKLPTQAALRGNSAREQSSEGPDSPKALKPSV